MALVGQELERKLDELVALHAPALISLVITTKDSKCLLPGDQDTTIEIPQSPSLSSSLELLRWTCQAFAKRSFIPVVQCLLSWLAARGPAVTASANQIASWLVAHLLLSIMQTKDAVPLTPEAMSQISDSVLNASMHVFHEAYQRECARSNESTSFFAFKSSTHSAKPPSVDIILQERVVMQWRLVLANLAVFDSLNSVRSRFQRELSTHNHQSNRHSSGPTKHHVYLQNLSEMGLNFASRGQNAPSSSVAFAQKMKDAGLFLKMLHPFMLKPNKTPMRLIAMTIVVSIIQRELKDLDRTDLHLVYTTAQVSEWNSCISDLHAFAMKTCSKKDLAATAWELRVAVLCIAPIDIFTRYWKDDVHALLRLQYQHNKDGHSTSGQAPLTLECIGLCFRHLLLRHFTMDRTVPSESDCMEIINTMQAWCFFSVSRHKGTLQKFRDCVLPVLVDISVGIAAYNMTYAVQSHLRRLLMEAESIFDEKKLIGLEALVRICQECFGQTDENAKSKFTRAFQLDRKILQSNRHVLGDLVGHILIECNTSFGQEGVAPASLISSGSVLSTSRFMRDDYKRAVAIEIFGTALFSLQHVYMALELSEDQKILLLARATIHNDVYIRQRANQALHAIVCITEKPKAGLVIRGLTDFLLRLSNGTAHLGDDTPFSILICLISSLLEAATRNQALMHWEHSRAISDSLVQIEAACLYLFVHEDTQLRLHTLEALETVRTARRRMEADHNSSQHQQSVLDVIDALEAEFARTFFSFEPSTETNPIIPQDGGCFKRLAGNTAFTRPSFRWSYCLSLLYSQLSYCVPDVTAFIWAEMSDKTLKLEPVMPSVGENEGCNSAELSRWRNLAIFCTSTACLMPCASINSADGSLSSVQSVISMNAVVTLIKRLGRYLKSFSMDQKKAVILALGSTNASSLSILIEVLDKYEPEAFEVDRGSLQQQQSQRTESLSEMNIASGTLDAIGNRKHSKVFRAKILKPVAQLHLQWAICRCYRMCLDTANRYLQYQMQSNEQKTITELEVFLAAVPLILGKMKQGMESRSRINWGVIGKDNGHFHFMMQQDFCAAIRVYIHLTAPVKYHEPLETQETPDVSSVNTSIHKQMLEGSFELLRSWASSFRSLVSSKSRNDIKDVFFCPNIRIYDYWMNYCDVFGENAHETIIPWHWIDEELRPFDSDGVADSQLQSSQNIFTCQFAFAAMAALLEYLVFYQQKIDSTLSVFEWFDECFGVNANEVSSIRPLQKLCKRGLQSLLKSEFSTFSTLCVEKTYFTQSGGDQQLLAKRYFESLVDQIDRLRIELKNHHDQKSPQIVVRVLHMLILHLGVQHDESHRILALNTSKRMLDSFIDWPPEIIIRDARSRSARDLSVLANQVMDHTQILVSTVLARKFSTVSFAFCSTLLRFLGNCDGTLQNQMLGVVVPWISELDLVGMQTDNNSEGDQHSENLLPLLFRLTIDLNAKNSNHLEHIWLALAFHQPHNQSADAESLMERDISSNLSVVVQFLFVQRASLEQLDTARLIFWWLCRWQQASPQVVRTLANYVVVRRRQHVFSINDDGNDAPVDDLAVFIALICDSCCHLQIHSNSNDVDLIIQTIHNALLTLFSVAMRNHKQPSSDHKDAKPLPRPRQSAPCTEKQAPFDLEHMVYADVHRDCLVVLRTLKSKRPESSGLFEPILKSICDPLPHLKKVSEHQSTLEEFRRVIRSFASSMSAMEIALWSDECVTEILLAISTPNSPSSASSVAVPLSGPQSVTCVRFALLVYETLAPAFHGDVYLSVLELLHIALDGQKQDSNASTILVSECLTTLAGLTRRMPVSKLALYPQVLWVCLALLNHCKQYELHPSILALLLEIVSKPHFATNQLLQDIIISKRPAQWVNQQCSILLSVTSNLQGSCTQSRTLVRRIILKLVLFPRQFLCVDYDEHLMISTISLLPEIVVLFTESDKTSLSSSTTWVKHQLLEAFSSLSAQWSESKHDACRKLGEWLEQFTTQNLQLPSTQITSIPESFAGIFIPMVLETQHLCPQLDAISMSFDILLRLSFTASVQDQNEGNNQSSEGSKPPSMEDTYESGITAAALSTVDSLLVHMELHSFAWTPPASLLGSLVRIAHAPQHRPQWQTVVRLLSYVAATSDSVPLPSPPQPQRRQLSITFPTPEASAPATVSTPAKRDSLGSARKFMNLMTMRSNNGPHSDPPPSVPKHKDPTSSQRTSMSDQQQSGEDVRA